MIGDELVALNSFGTEEQMSYWFRSFLLQENILLEKFADLREDGEWRIYLKQTVSFTYDE